jgi:TPR repeat protein
MSARATSRLACLLLAAGCIGFAAAQDRPAGAAASPGKVSVEDLKTRSAAGDRSATRQLAEMYYVGRGGVEQDFAEAARWYEVLARQGDARAQTSLGLMYARGYGVERNMQTAHRWWSFAAAQNDPGAQFNLGLSYSRGEGVARDYQRAAEWYNRAAVRGHVQAQRNLGLLLYEGKGVERDAVRAYYWLRLAELQGEETAREARGLVGRELNAEQIRDAESQAREWIRKYKKIVAQ